MRKEQAGSLRSVAAESRSQGEKPVEGKNSFIKPLCGGMKTAFLCGNPINAWGVKKMEEEATEIM